MREATTDKPACSAKVWASNSAGWGHRHPCGNKATKDGFCGVHHPDAVARRDAKSDERDRQQREKFDRQHRERSLREAMHQAALKWRENTSHDIELLRAVDAYLEHRSKT